MCDVQVKAMRVGTISLYTKVSLSTRSISRALPV
jgi:hypothetical protein